MVAQYEAAPHGEKAAVLRREGLYQSQVREWRAERDARAAWLGPETPFAQGLPEIVGGGLGSAPHRKCKVDRGIGEVAGSGADNGETARSLGNHLREDGHPTATDEALTAAFAELRS